MGVDENAEIDKMYHDILNTCCQALVNAKAVTVEEYQNFVTESLEHKTLFCRTRGQQWMFAQHRKIHART